MADPAMYEVAGPRPPADLLDDGSAVQPDPAVAAQNLSPQDLRALDVSRQAEDPSITGLPPGESRPMFPNVPAGTGLTWSTTGGVSSPVTAIAGPRPPSDPRAALFAQQAASNEALWRRLKERTAQLPIAQTEAAVAAAMRFQGQRQYQRDLDAGIPAHEALARSAPLMFAGPKQSSLGQAAQFMKAAAPTPKFHNVGGVLYKENPDGTVSSVTGPAAPKFHTAGGVLYREGAGGKMEPMTPAPPPKTNAFDTEEYRNVLQEIRDNDKAISDLPMASPRAQPLHERARFLRNRLDEIRGRVQSPTRTGTSAKRIRVRSPEGKTGTISESNLEAAKAAGYTEVR